MATGAAGDFVVGFSFSEAAAAIAGSDPVGGTPALLSFTSGTCEHEVKAQRTSVSDVWLIVWGVGKARKRASLSHTHMRTRRFTSSASTFFQPPPPAFIHHLPPCSRYSGSAIVLFEERGFAGCRYALLRHARARRRRWPHLSYSLADFAPKC